MVPGPGPGRAVTRMDAEARRQAERDRKRAWRRRVQDAADWAAGAAPGAVPGAVPGAGQVGRAPALLPADVGLPDPVRDAARDRPGTFRDRTGQVRNRANGDTEIASYNLET